MFHPIVIRSPGRYGHSNRSYLFELLNARSCSAGQSRVVPRTPAYKNDIEPRIPKNLASVSLETHGENRPSVEIQRRQHFWDEIRKRTVERLSSLSCNDLDVVIKSALVVSHDVISTNISFALTGKPSSRKICGCCT